MIDPVLVSVVAAGVIAYFIGSIPFGFLIGKAKGVDLRQHGSGNIGATNAGRVLGGKWFFIVFLLDFSKGLVPVLLAYVLRYLAQEHQLGDIELGDVMLTAGIGACLGHVYPIWLSFRGGKAAATGLGVLTAMLPLVGAMCLGVFLLLLLVSKYVSLASIFGALAAPGAFVLWYQGETWDAPQLARFIVLACMSALIIYRHRSNIKRLLDGTETRVKLGRAAAQTE